MKTILIFIATIIGKVWIFACLPFRAYARNYVYNYVLQNEIYLKRLNERHPQPVVGGWALPRSLNADHGSMLLREGFIKYRKVNRVQFYLVVFFIWGFLDDDSVHDTTDLTGYIRELVTGYRWKGGAQTDEKLYRWQVIFRPWLKKIDASRVEFGSAFDLGDARKPYLNWLAAFVWNDRNTAQNFQYLFTDY